LPEHLLVSVERLALPLRSFRLPVSVAPVKVMQAWHPRFDHDPAHRWLRETLKALCDRYDA
jgi:DNA-binding transcriptional LysR family regulator